MPIRPETFLDLAGADRPMGAGIGIATAIVVVPVRESAGSASKPLVHNRIPGLGTFTGKAAYSYASYSVAPARSRRWGSVALSGGAELSDVACGLTAVLEDRRRTSIFPKYRLHLLKRVTQIVMMSSVSRL